MIDRKFLFFKNRKTFEEKLRQGEINRKESIVFRKESIVFIEGETPADRAIWTHNVFYEPSTGLEHSKGFFESYQALYNAWPWPLAGDWAIVADDASIWVLGEEFPATLCEHVSGDWYIYTCPQNGKWVKSQRQYGKEDIDLSEYLKKDDIDPIDITKLQEDVEDIKSAINDTNEELGNREYTYLIFLTEAQYNELTEYEEDAIYFVMQSD